MIISELNLPNITFGCTERDGHSTVLPGKPWDYLSRVNLLPLSRDRTLSVLVAEMKPFHRTTIHQDWTNNTDAITWSLLLGGHGLILEIYEPTDNNIATGDVSAPNGEYSVPTLPPENARLIESKYIADKPTLFNPSDNWHSVYNPTDKWIKCVSLRSKSIEAAEYLRTFMVKN